MSTATPTKTSHHFPAAGTWTDPDTDAEPTTPHVVTWTDPDTDAEPTTPHVVTWFKEGRLYIAPECGYQAETAKVAGVLFLAGVPLELVTEGDSTPELTTATDQQGQVIRTLREAGADVTIIYPLGDDDF